MVAGATFRNAYAGIAEPGLGRQLIGGHWLQWGQFRFFKHPRLEIETSSGAVRAFEKRVISIAVIWPVQQQCFLIKNVTHQNAPLATLP